MTVETPRLNKKAVVNKGVNSDTAVVLFVVFLNV